MYTKKMHFYMLATLEYPTQEGWDVKPLSVVSCWAAPILAGLGLIGPSDTALWLYGSWLHWAPHQTGRPASTHNLFLTSGNSPGSLTNNPTTCTTNFCRPTITDFFDKLHLPPEPAGDLTLMFQFSGYSQSSSGSVRIP